LGMKLSAAAKLARRGKSAKLVLAPAPRISIVPAWRAKNRVWPRAVVP